MAAQTLDQVISSLNGIYQPQLDSISAQQAALPAQYDAQAQGLQAQQTQAFGDILNGARSRGLGFSGIPLADQAQYTASTYLPALANLKTAQTNQLSSLTDAINKINEDKFNTANNIYQFGVNQDYQQQQLAEQAREANQSAATANSFNPSYGSTDSTSAAQMQSRGGGQFNFQDAGGKAISAAKYAQLTGQDPLNFLYQLGQQGDKTSALAYYQLSKANTPQAQANVKKQYSALFWGT